MTDVPVGLIVRKLAAEDGLERVRRFDPITGDSFWVSPATGEPLPKTTAGVQLEHDTPPPLVRIPAKYVGREDWIELVNARPVHKPAGPADDPWRSTHTFVHCDELVLHLVGRDVRYRVIHQPDKYDDETGAPSEAPGDPTTHVDHYYDAELITEEA